jgi:hypothetical protein
MEKMQISGTVSGQYKYVDACLGSVSFVTNGPQGGDAGHGGYLEVTFDTANCSTALDVTVDGRRAENVRSVTLRFAGDAEMRSAAECFEFLSRKLAALQGHPDE